ncbi:N-acyl-D-amino-acid deacylase family protein [Halomicrococcus sp. NG-SE-24]|uniref:N-acyl-D-amino-acid deacylase family protein n=1 Tax=Halomicrococcus sp. NG-SE-24 TaxID=3436928 RepID=UPI003D96E306
MATDAQLLIRDARIVDGSGSPWYTGHVLIDDGTITELRRGDGEKMTGDIVVDADSRIVCPGFIDVHSHSDLELFEDGTLAPKIRQGITTEILGQDGFSMAPVTGREAQQAWQDTIADLAGRTDHGWTWDSVSEYLAAVEEHGIAPNVGTLVGHGTVRFEVMGMSDRTPAADEVEAMADLVTAGLEQGAVGFSTGLVYPPQYNADTAEVAALASRLHPYGRPFVAHIRSEGRWLWEALDEFIDIGAEYEIPLHLSHFKVAGKQQQGKSDRALHRLDAARERGVDITADQYPYAAGSSPLSALLPPWVHTDGPSGVLERLHDSELRERIKVDIERWRIEGWENYGAQAGWDNVVIAHVESDANEHLQGMSVAAIASERGVHPVDVVCDLLVEEELEVTSIEHGMAEEDVERIMADRRAAVATDGLFGGQPHPRTYGTYPRILGTYVRERNHLELEEAIRKMTSLPARAMGLSSKGLLRPEMDADIVVFDPSLVDARSTFDSSTRFPVGIDHVLVNGEPVVTDGEVTGNRPGAVIRAQ